MKIRKITATDIRKLLGTKGRLVLLAILATSVIFMGVSAYRNPGAQISNRDEMEKTETKNVNDGLKNKPAHKDKVKKPATRENAASRHAGEPVTQAINNQPDPDVHGAVPENTPNTPPKVPVDEDHLVASSYSVKLGGSTGETTAYVTIQYASRGTIESLQISKQPQFQVQSSVSFNGAIVSESRLAGTTDVAKRTLVLWQHDPASSGNATVYISTSPRWQPLAIHVSWSPKLD